MARGRKALPDEIKALKGNPGKRRLMLEDRAAGSRFNPDPLPSISFPEFLTHEREREIFRRVVEDYLQRRIARETDLIPYARWATYMHNWWACKELLDSAGTAQRYMKQTSNHGERWVKHPTWALQSELETMILSLEKELGLSPSARASILRGLAAMPAGIAGVMSQHAQPVEQPPNQEQEAPKPDEDSPIGFLHSQMH